MPGRATLPAEPQGRSGRYTPVTIMTIMQMRMRMDVRSGGPAR